jgi:hypothetical protein
VATAEEWELTLKRAVGAPDMTGSEPASKLQRDLVLGGTPSATSTIPRNRYRGRG